MKLPWTREADDATTSTLKRPTDRRWAVRWCAVCRSPHPPLIYFENGKHYCELCAAKVYAVMGVRSAGKRQGDTEFP